MKLLIKRQCLSYGRRIYRAGDTADIADDELARRLAAKSHGDFELVSANDEKNSDAAVAASGETVQETITEEETVSGQSKEEADIEETAEPTDLPAVDFAATVKETKPKAKKKR